MADEKKKAAAVPSNPTEIVWPSDPTGVTSELKKVLVRTAGRVNGQADKLEAVLEVLKIGFGHVTARHGAQVEDAKRDIEWRAEQDAKRAAALN